MSTKSDGVENDGFKIQILCKFQKCEEKVPPPSLLFFSDFFLGSKYKGRFKKTFFGGTVKELFTYIFEILIKFGFKFH